MEFKQINQLLSPQKSPRGLSAQKMKFSIKDFFSKCDSLNSFKFTYCNKNCESS